VTAALLYAASEESSLTTTKNILLAVGLVYLAIGTTGLVDKRAGGLLPSGLTKFDLVYHFVVGAGIIWLGVRRSKSS
jgi:hypothetical protein